MKKLVTFFMVIFAFVSFSSASANEYLEKLGFLDAERIYEVPQVLQGSMLAMAVQESGKEIQLLDYPIRMGRVYEDYLTFDKSSHRFNSIYYGTLNGAGAVIIFSGHIVFLFQDMGVEARRYSRFMLQVINIDTGFSSKFFLQ